MKLFDQIRANTELVPHYNNEPFWEVILPEEAPFHYALSRIFLLNSLTNTRYQELRAVKDSVLYIWIPQKIIRNHDSKLLHDNLDWVIANRIKFLRCVDGYFWVVDDEILEESKNSGI